ncbi:4Fe-4S binding protein [Azospirillum sp. TSO22-1]|uniref:4Fe-4S binding protein n=1 Tax=Azospirillum sp. TSO22-1 TaxID=716789 RepID=UPI000D620C3F|nr:4Fe-4S binding protein [Azospirillum sp. TSO22-1]PWC40366.1 polyferredoxin [Azospirillum sp. TSO22-1]
MTALQRFGDALHRRQDVVRRVQWAMVALYLVLLLLPPLLPAAPDARALVTLARLAEALFWGVWWPGVILSTLLFGQFWCGLFCPDGAVTEAASRHGRALKVPAGLRWPGWPLLGFAALTLAGDLGGVQYDALGTLLVVGGSSAAALAVGALYGRGKRVWCRYLCPMAGLFSILARASALHFRVDRTAWDAAARPVPKPVDCPLLLDVRRLTSNEKCNMCGRCSGHRNAVALAARPLGAEIATLEEEEARGWEALGIAFVLVGLTWAGIHWRGSPWHGWLLTAIGPLGGWGDAAAALAAVLLPALTLGAATAALLLLAAGGRRIAAYRLAYGLIPLAGLGLFLGALEHSLAILQREGVEALAVLPWLRAAVLAAGVAWSARLGRPLAPSRASYAVYLATLVLLALCHQGAPVAAHP